MRLCAESDHVSLLGLIANGQAKDPMDIIKAPGVWMRTRFVAGRQCPSNGAHSHLIAKYMVGNLKSNSVFKYHLTDTNSVFAG